MASGPNVWTLDTSTISARRREALTAILSREERERAARLLVQADRVAYALAHCLARLALARAAGCEPAQLRFGKGRYGRPFAIAPRGARAFRFNLSHTEGFVGVAVSRNPVGLDVEYMLRRLNFAGVAEDVFTQEEARSLLYVSPAESRRRFFQLWTLREAYLKATGLGLQGNPRSWSFEQRDNGLALHPPANVLAQWSFVSRLFDGKHCLALCYASQDSSARFHDGRALLIRNPE